MKLAEAGHARLRARTAMGLAKLFPRAPEPSVRPIGAWLGLALVGLACSSPTAPPKPSTGASHPAQATQTTQAVSATPPPSSAPDAGATSDAEAPDATSERAAGAAPRSDRLTVSEYATNVTTDRIPYYVRFLIENRKSSPTWLRVARVDYLGDGPPRALAVQRVEIAEGQYPEPQSSVVHQQAARDRITIPAGAAWVVTVFFQPPSARAGSPYPFRAHFVDESGAAIRTDVTVARMFRIPRAP